MKTTKKMIAVMIITVSLGATLVQAKNYNLDLPDDTKAQQKPRTEVTQFVKNNDYEGFKKWAEQANKTKLEQTITPEKFAKMVELYQAVEAKDWAKAKALKAEIGFKRPGFKGGPMHKMMKKGMQQMKDRFSKLSDDTKAQLKEAFKAHDRAKVQQILEANGITFPKMVKNTSN